MTQQMIFLVLFLTEYMILNVNVVLVGANTSPRHLIVQQWAENHGYLLNKQVKIQRFGDARTGVLNTRLLSSGEIHEGDPIFEAPYWTMLNKATIEGRRCSSILQDKQLGMKVCKFLLKEMKAPSKEYIEVEEKMILAVYVAIVSKTGLGEYGDYIKYLPLPSQLNVEKVSIIFYPREVAALFSPYSLDTQEFMEIMQTATPTFYEFLPDYITSLITLDDLKFAFHLVSSRAFLVDFPDSEHKYSQYLSMIPILDYANHRANSSLFMKEKKIHQNKIMKTGRYEIISGYSLKSNQEIFTSYGNVRNVHLFLLRSFVPDYVDDNRDFDLLLTPAAMDHDKNDTILFSKKSVLFRQMISKTRGYVEIQNCVLPNIFRLLVTKSLTYLDQLKKAFNSNVLKNHEPIIESPMQELRAKSLFKHHIEHLKEQFQNLSKEYEASELFTPMLKKLYLLEIKHLNLCLEQISDKSDLREDL